MMENTVKLIFEPKIKSRKRYHSSIETQLLPKAPNENYTAIFTGFSVELTNSGNKDIRSLYENGCFGKGSHSRSFPMSWIKTATLNSAAKHEEILVLDLEEAFFLAYFLTVLNIVNLNDETMDRESTFKEFQRIKPNFVYTMTAYLYFKSKGWVTKSGTKFGGDFLLYKESTRFYHASFIAIVLPEGRNMLAKDLQGMHRIAETSNKDLILLNVHAPSDIAPSEHYNYLQSFKVTETIPRRFDLKKHVQS